MVDFLQYCEYSFDSIKETCNGCNEELYIPKTAHFISLSFPIRFTIVFHSKIFPISLAAQNADSRKGKLPIPTHDAEGIY